MGYICIRPMKVQTREGEIVIRQTGDEVPEAEDWPNPAVWIRRGYIQPTDAETAQRSGYTREKLQPVKVATEKDAERAVSKVPKPEAPLPGHEDGNAVRQELLELSRADLDALAEEHGIAEPAKMANKRAVADAILEKQAG